MLTKSNITNQFFWKGSEITGLEYNRIFEIIKNKPIPPDGYDYRLTDELEWELYELPIVEELENETLDETSLKAKAYDIITGGVG